MYWQQQPFCKKYRLEPAGITTSTVMIWMNLGYSHHEDDNGIKIVVAFELQFNIIKMLWGCLAYWGF